MARVVGRDAELSAIRGFVSSISEGDTVRVDASDGELVAELAAAAAS